MTSCRTGRRCPTAYRASSGPTRWPMPAQVPLGAEQHRLLRDIASGRRLRELVDFNLRNQCTPRLTVGAANVGTGRMRYFDSRDIALDVHHVMASGALPPAFPAVRIDGELYWDGGILQTPRREAVFDDNPRQNSLMFAVHLGNASGPSGPRCGTRRPSKRHSVFEPGASRIAARSRRIVCAMSSTSSLRACPNPNATARR